MRMRTQTHAWVEIEPRNIISGDQVMYEGKRSAIRETSTMQPGILFSQHNTGKSTQDLLLKFLTTMLTICGSWNLVPSWDLMFQNSKG